MLDRLVAWIETNPGVRRALPWVSGVLVGLGLIVVFTSFGGGGPTPPSEPEAPSVTVNLTKAADAAQEYRNERVPPTFEGFSVSTAEGMEPSLTWVKGDPSAPDEIEIRKAKSKNLLLIASDGTTTYCLALDNTGTRSMGTVDAEQSGDCTGGW